MNTFICLLIFLFGTSLSERRTYEGYRTFSIYPKSEEQLSLIDLLRHIPRVDVLTENKKDKSMILVPPDLILDFAIALKLHNINYNVTESRMVSKPEQGFSRRSLGVNRGFQLNKFNRYKEIDWFIHELAKKYPDRVSLIEVGLSTEERAITAVKISSGGEGKPAIFIDAGIHAREWLAPSTALYMMDQLVENSENDYLLENVDWFIIPLLNPDGYEYTHSKDRLWRKTRAPGKRCYGVDANRNFGFHWMESGASTKECEVIFGGKKPFSVPETVYFRNFAYRYKNVIKLYVSLHSFGAMLLYPWGYSKDLPKNADELQYVGEAVAKMIQTVRGTNYTVGSSATVLYPAAGGSDDWIKGVAGVPLAYTMELPEGGKYGFDAPESMILDVGKETFQGFKIFWKYVQTKWGGRVYYNRNNN